MLLLNRNRRKGVDAQRAAQNTAPNPLNMNYELNRGRREERGGRRDKSNKISKKSRVPMDMVKTNNPYKKRPIIPTTKLNVLLLVSLRNWENIN